jgi:hypothetical protein
MSDVNELHPLLRPFDPRWVPTAEDLNRMVADGWVVDHEYIGNICGGFGGKTECKKIDYDTGSRCRKSPFEHRYVRPKRRGPGMSIDLSRTPEDYEPRHRLEESVSDTRTVEG